MPQYMCVQYKYKRVSGGPCGNKPEPTFFFFNNKPEPTKMAKSQETKM